MKYPTQSKEELREIADITASAVEEGFEAANSEWRNYALACLKHVATRRAYLTVNDVRELVNKSPYTTHDKRAMGGVLATGKSYGWIVPSGETRVNKTGHGVPMQVWKSLIYSPKTVKVLEKVKGK